MNRNLAITAAVVVLIAVIAAAAFIFLRAAPTAAVKIAPGQMQAAMGQDFEVNFTVSDVKDLFGWQAKIRWNTTLLEAVNIVEGGFLKGKGETFFLPQTDNTAGYVIAVCTLVSDTTGADGQGVLATVTFRAKAMGSGIFDLYETMLLNSTEQEITHTEADGQFTGTAPDEDFD